jgi:hypothetical protein
MCKFWRKFCKTEKKNHHFPELSSVSNLKGAFFKITVSKTAMAAVIALNLVLAFFYLTQTNQTATSGYQIKGLEKELARLEDENKKLNLDYIRLQSMDKIVSGVKNMNLVPADNIEVITAGDSALALGHN